MIEPIYDYHIQECGRQVVFAQSQQEAWELRDRERFCGKENFTDDIFHKCDRTPYYDKYLESGFGTREMVIEAWKLKCNKCYGNINYEVDVIVDGEKVFCGYECFDSWLKNQNIPHKSN